MSNKKGFTLIECIVVLIIIGILAAVAVPNYTNYQLQQAALAAQNNLVTIYNAEKAYYLNPATGGNYYISAITPNDPALNATLNVNITDSYFEYACSVDPLGSGFLCTAQNFSTPKFKLNVSNTGIYLPGSNGNSALGCALNPNCVFSAYCPPQAPAC